MDFQISKPVDLKSKILVLIGALASDSIKTHSKKLDK
jgi:hypothetical protein